MRMRRTVGTWLAAGIVAAATVALAAQAASAQTSSGNPVSRGAACSPANAENAGNPACAAAIAAGPADALGTWQTDSVKNVNGNDQQSIPDGHLCSGGLPQLTGLDLARSDWPATVVTGGARYEFRYPAAVPHAGIFRLYLTKQGYDPGKPLTWSELDPDPLAVVTDPPLDGSVYHFFLTWPTDRMGRQVLFSIWQNTDGPESHYSCSDLTFQSANSPAIASARRGAAGCGSTTNSAAEAARLPGTAIPADSKSLPAKTVAAARPRATLSLVAAVVGGALLAFTGMTLFILTFYVRRLSRR